MKIFATTVLMTLSLLSLHLQAWSTDTFPLDLWEEMTAWERSRIESHNSMMKADSESDSPHVKSAAMVPLSFPFDVQKELDDLDGTERKRTDSNRYRNRTTGTIRGNAYWLP